MQKNKTSFFFLLFLATTLFVGCLLFSENSEKHRSSFSVEKELKIEQAMEGVPLAISYHRQEISPSNFLIKLQRSFFLFITIALFLQVLSFLLKKVSKETFFIYHVRMRYFIDDLDVCILSSRAHPPTK